MSDDEQEREVKQLDCSCGGQIRFVPTIGEASVMQHTLPVCANYLKAIEMTGLKKLGEA